MRRRRRNNLRSLEHNPTIPSPPEGRGFAKIKGCVAIVVGVERILAGNRTEVFLSRGFVGGFGGGGLGAVGGDGVVGGRREGIGDFSGLLVVRGGCIVDGVFLGGLLVLIEVRHWGGGLW